jgi:hypothetical protein
MELHGRVYDQAAPIQNQTTRTRTHKKGAVVLSETTAPREGGSLHY